METDQQKIINQGIEYIETVNSVNEKKNEDWRLDYSEESLSRVQYLISTLKGASKLRPGYKDACFIGMAVYLGKMLIRRFPKMQFIVTFKNSAVDEIRVADGNNFFNLLSWVRKYYDDPENEVISFKYRIICEDLQKSLNPRDTSTNDREMPKGNESVPGKPLKLKCVLYTNVVITKGSVVPVTLRPENCLEIEKLGYFVVFLKKDKETKNPQTQDLYKRGYLMKFLTRVLVTDWPTNSFLSLPKSAAVFSSFLAMVTEEIELLEFDPKPFVATFRPAKLLIDDTRTKDYKTRIIEKFDKVLVKLGRPNVISEYYNVDSIEDLLNATAKFLTVQRQISQQAALKYSQSNNISERVEIIIDLLDKYYFSFDLNNKVVSSLPSKPQVTRTKSSVVDVTKYRQFLETVTGMSDDQRETLGKKIDHLESMTVETGERASLISYLETAVSIPWGKCEGAALDIKKIRGQLDDCQYGMRDAKARLLEHLAVTAKKKGDFTGLVLCLIGSPGVGKTLFAKNIAKVLGRKSVSIALGGMDDVSVLRGQRRGWIGAEPGQIIKALIQVKSMNPIIILDEIDKIGGHRGDQVKAALLEILDPNQNNEFKDSFLDMPIDISKVLFVSTANYYAGLPLALRDRLEVIQIEPYSEIEKLEIAKRFVIPKILSESGLSNSDLVISDDVVKKIVGAFKFDGGMRRVERTLIKIIHKFVLDKMEGGVRHTESRAFEITLSNLGQFAKIDSQSSSSFDPNASVVGEINMLWAREDDTGSVVGGGRGSIQIRILPGNGKDTITGSIMDVFKQSIDVAKGYIKSHSKEFGMEEDFFSRHDLLLHCPDTSVKKDGPSAGVAIVLCLLSAIKNLQIPQSFAVTGEVDLLGNVLPVGGIKSKIGAAYQAGVKTFILSRTNKNDFDEEVPEEIKNNVNVHFVSNVSEAVRIFFPDHGFSL